MSPVEISFQSHFALVYRGKGVRRSLYTDIERADVTLYLTDYLKKYVILYIWQLPYKRTVSDPAGDLQRWVSTVGVCLLLPLGGTDIGCKVGLQKASCSSPPRGLLPPLTLFWTSWFSITLYLAPSSLFATTTMLTSEVKILLAAYCHRMAIVGRPIVSQDTSLIPDFSGSCWMKLSDHLGNQNCRGWSFSYFDNRKYTEGTLVEEYNWCI